MAKLLDRLAAAIERAAWLDAPADALAGVLRRLLPKGPVKDVASGAPIGHPVHPLLVAVPIGSWAAATYLDATGGRSGRVAARRLVGLGNAAAVPTAVAGISDWVDTTGAERRVGLVHSVLNTTALGLYTGSWIARRRGRYVTGTLLSLAGGGVLAGAGWLGGHMSYALGVGVDTTAFRHLPQEWTDVAAESDVMTGQATCVDAGGVPVLLARHEGSLVALADRCTHRGGALHEGELGEGCVTCPWHGSRFRLVDGAVDRGPAVRPAPVLEARVIDGRVQVRRGDEPRSLRSNPIGV